MPGANIASLLIWRGWSCRIFTGRHADFLGGAFTAQTTATRPEWRLLLWPLSVALVAAGLYGFDGGDVSDNGGAVGAVLVGITMRFAAVRCHPLWGLKQSIMLAPALAFWVLFYGFGWRHCRGANGRGEGPIVIFRGSYRKIVAVRPKHVCQNGHKPKPQHQRRAVQQTGPQNPSGTGAGRHAKCGATPGQSRKISKNRQPSGQS